MVRIYVFIEAKSEAKIRLVFVFTLSGSIYFFIMIYGRQRDFLVPKPIKCQFSEADLLLLLLLLLFLFWLLVSMFLMILSVGGAVVIVHFVYVFLHFVCV